MKIITSDQARSLKSFTASVSNALYGRGVVGQVGDVITFDRALTTPERRSVEEYLSNKWGVPLVPQAPTSVVAALVREPRTRPSPGRRRCRTVVPPISGYTVTSAPDGKTCPATSRCHAR